MKIKVQSFLPVVLMGVIPIGAFVAIPPATKPQNPVVVDAAGYTKTARPFLDKHCVPCHSGEKPQGAFRTDAALRNDFTDPATKAKWSEIVRVLNSHLMPPKGQEQPAPTEVSTFVDWITAQMVAADSAKQSSASVLRRLTRDEYKNTIHDLTGVDFDVSGFPADPPSGGFDNNARSLTVSPLHIEMYAGAARKILDQALIEGPEPPKIHWHFDPKVVPEDSRREKLDEQNPSVIINGGENRTEGDWVVMHTDGWNKSVNARNFQVPVEGYYTVRIRAACKIPGREQVVEAAKAILAKRRSEEDSREPKAAKYHQEAYDNDLKHFEISPIYNYGPPRGKLVEQLGSQPRTVAEFDVDAPLSAPKTYEFKVRFTTESAGINLWNVYSIPSVLENFWCQNHDAFARPELYVDWWEIEGPVYDAWPPSSDTRILFPSPLRQSNERAYAREVLARFMRRAYRRPVAANEIETKLALYDHVRKEQSFLEAIKAPLTAILASPNFLFLVEPGEHRKLNDYELAARLSYFLWGTLPDAELSKLANEGKLHAPDILRAQTDRLLKSPRSSEFVRRFADQWLGLGQVGANPPATNLYPEYDRHFESSIIIESEKFFAEILNNDLDISNLIRSDFVVINERLARAYGIPGVKGDGFRRVAVPPGVRRGGIPTQASILTITSNGTRTSPVKRGVWIMKTLLDADPGLPVANVGEISAKLAGIEKATVRQRLEFHRTRPQCARCHSHIDPLGFSLENYDAAGLWRDREGFGYNGRVEPGDPLVDAGSELPDGTKIVGVDGLQKAILTRNADFERCLASKMLTFALGRELTVSDRPVVSSAISHLNKNGRTLRSLIEFITTSETFRSK